jgi:hypothetical protein
VDIIIITKIYFNVIAPVPHQLPGKVDPRRWQCQQSDRAAVWMIRLKGWKIREQLCLT